MTKKYYRISVISFSTAKDWPGRHRQASRMSIRSLHLCPPTSITYANDAEIKTSLRGHRDGDSPLEHPLSIIVFIKDIAYRPSSGQSCLGVHHLFPHPTAYYPHYSERVAFLQCENKEHNKGQLYLSSYCFYFLMGF